MKLKFGAKVYLWVVIILGLVPIALYMTQISLTPSVISTLVLFSLIAFLAEIYEIEITYRRATSTSIAIYSAAIFLGGAPLAIAAVLLATLCAEIILRWDKLSDGIMAFFYRVGFNISQFILSASIASAIFTLTGGHSPPYNSIADYIPAIIAFLAFSFINTSLVSGIITLTTGISFTYHLKFNLRYLHVQILSLGVLAILIAVVYSLSPWNIFLVLIPMALVHLSLRNYMRLRIGAKRTFEKMMELLSERNSYTATHSEEVAELAGKIARELKLPEDEVEVIKSAARIHDIGKIAIPDSILLKESKLTEEERLIIERHPVIGAELVKDLEIYSKGADIVKHEHEHWDGSGYPDGLKGEQIPIGARIVAAADIYCALTTDRPYRRAYSKEQALAMMEEMKGKELDPKVVEALAKVIKLADSDKR